MSSEEPGGLLTVSDDLLAVKQALATGLADSCCLCPRRCGVNRAAGERGYCGVGWPGHIGEEHIHFGEIDEIIPTHSVFFAGCTMRCIYCRKMPMVEDADYGVPFDPAAFGAVVEQRREQGARTLKLLGGTPEPQLPAIFDLLRKLPTRLPLAWETTLYISPEALELLVGVVDLLICNVRYGNDRCAQRLSDTPDYVQSVRDAFEANAGRIPVALRHLVLPGHIECCTAAVARLTQELAPETPLMLLMQYSPFGTAMDDPVLGHALTQDERQQALTVARSNKELVEVWG